MINGARLTKLRKEKGVTIEYLAEKFGYSTAFIGFIEKEKRRPNTDLLKDLAEYFGVTTDYLLGCDSSDASTA